MPSDALSGISSFMSSGGLLIILMIGMFALMIIPQRKREKKIKDMLAAIKVGDRVRTIGGIYGTVSALRDDIVTLTVGPDKVRLVFARGAIANVENVPVEATMDDGVAETK
ncbi:MAG: preprotein translocase subunit YajC [Oscillospiraceae bacterium]|jgi:preprotein translocase subunit YajC|nr:preprotein translocase subunit YajC [Christensenellales bacterium]